MEFEEVVQLLNSGQLPDQVDAIVFASENRELMTEQQRIAIADAAVRSLSASDAKFVLADRMLGLGKEVISPAKSQLAESNDIELRVYLSCILVANHEQAGVPVLLDEVKEAGEYLSISARLLARNNIVEVAPKLTDVLVGIDLGTDAGTPDEQCDLVVGLLRDLSRVVDRIPPVLLERFKRNDVPKYLSRTVAQLWPSQ